MKKILFSMFLAVSFTASAQFTEGFDAGTTTPAGWTVINGGDANTFVFSAGSAGSALTAPNAAQINYSTAAHDDYLVTKAITVVAGVNDRFYYFAKNQDPLFPENYEVRLSNTGVAAANFTTVLTPSAAAPNTWTQFSLNLSAYIGQTVYLGFHATSADKFRLLFDQMVSYTAPTVVPNCPVLTSPANGSTGVAYSSVTLNWTAPAGGGVVEYYDVYADTNPNPTTKLGVAVNPTFTAVNLASSSTIYWKVIAKNAAGESITCQVFSFTTATNPLAPYCGPATYANGVEPITSVSFGGMVNTSSATVGGTNAHEAFLSSVANVNRAATLPIVLKGNTDGGFSDRFLVFIDWNQDGDFADTGEAYFTTGTAVTVTNSTGVDAISATGNITVPTTALLGNTRMRVKKTYGATLYADPCTGGSATLSYGQSEDYTVNVADVLAVNDVVKNKLSVYPNPVKDVLNITNGNGKISQTLIYSIDGKLIKTFTGDKNSVKMNDLAPGVYLVKVKTSTGEQSFKVIKE